MIKNTHRIVLTGGPGGGKSTATDLIRRELGERVVVVPEAATMLFSGGFPRSAEVPAQVATQKTIYHAQKNMEDIHHSLYPGRVLLCDRGTVDGAAYWPKASDDFFATLSTNLKQELARYDAVIFFESAAIGNISIEGGNPTRLEDNAQAVKLDKELRSFWSRHHNFVHVPHEKSFFCKLTRALNAVLAMVEKLDAQ